MKRKLNLLAMAKKAESNRKAELDEKRMSDIRAGQLDEKDPRDGDAPISWEWVESLCQDWCSIGEQHYVTEFNDFKPLAGGDTN